jgi:hypothetical protein
LSLLPLQPPSRRAILEGDDVGEQPQRGYGHSGAARRTQPTPDINLGGLATTTLWATPASLMLHETTGDKT